ncbi:MAG: TMEM165/GDT1 family protein [Kiritimatiellae bacterium]|nr:TMEM165/GDT1 family protein [Kiritimatiellia bacterium]
MNWPLFCSTFLLVFLAELGDKTQMTVLSQSAANASKGTIFLAGSLALIAATAIGVAAGSWINRLVPDPRWIKLTGGLLFLCFGCMLFVEAFRMGRPVPVPVKVSGWIGRSVVREAEILERNAYTDFLALARDAETPEVREILESIAQEERWHHEAMLCALAGGAEKDIPFTEGMAAGLPEPDAYLVRAAGAEHPLEQAIVNKRRMIVFYQKLSAGLRESRLRDTFAGIAAAEENHARRLEGLRR